MSTDDKLTVKIVTDCGFLGIIPPDKKTCVTLDDVDFDCEKVQSSIVRAIGVLRRKRQTTDTPNVLE